MAENADSGKWVALLKAVAASDAEAIVIGGAALALHGIPRTTVDVDFIVPANGRSVPALFQLLFDQLGLTSQQLSMRDIGDPALLAGQVLTAGERGGPDMADVFFVTEREFNSIYETSVQVPVGDAVVDVAGIAELRRMKKEAGRPIDLADLALLDELENFQNGT